MNFEEKLKKLLEERETIISEMKELEVAYNERQIKIVELNGSIKTIQELINDNEIESKS